MRKNRRLQRLNRCLKRQPTTAWHNDYTPAIQATRAEAPSASWFGTLGGSNRFGRPLHFFSLAEKAALLICAYNPRVIDLREQFLLSPVPTDHPLHNHPRASGLSLLPLPGMVPIYETLGRLDLYPTVSEVAGAPKRPDVLVADLLLTLQDEGGPYVVAWNVKGSIDGFARPFNHAAKRNQQGAMERHAIRTLAEECYFSAANIPCYRVAGTLFDAQLTANLSSIYGWASRNISASDNSHLTNTQLQLHLGSIDFHKTSPTDAMQHYQLQYRVSSDQFKHCFYTLLWTRQIKTDLKRRLYFDAVLPAEREDPLDELVHLFARGP